MWPFKKKVPEAPTPESELRITLREATQKLYNQKRDNYVETILRQCRDASEKGDFSIRLPEKKSDGVFYDWAQDAFKLVREKGLEVTFDDRKEPTTAKVSWK